MIAVEIPGVPENSSLGYTLMLLGIPVAARQTDGIIPSDAGMLGGNYIIVVDETTCDAVLFDTGGSDPLTQLVYLNLSVSVPSGPPSSVSVLVSYIPNPQTAALVILQGTNTFGPYQASVSGQSLTVVLTQPPPGLNNGVAFIQPGDLINGVFVANGQATQGTIAENVVIPTIESQFSIDDITEYLDDVGFPSDELEANQISRAMNKAAYDLRQSAPVIKTGMFLTFPGQSKYDIFNSAAPEYINDSDGIYVLRVIWSQGSSLFTDADPFGITPYLQSNLGTWGSFPNFSFTTPGDYTIFNDNLSQWQGHYTGDFEQTSSEAGSPILLVPVPAQQVSVFVMYASLRSVSGNLSQEMSEAYLCFVEARLCKVMARMTAQISGISLGGFKDPGKTDKYWLDESLRCTNEGLNKLSNYTFNSFSLATRS